MGWRFVSWWRSEIQQPEACIQSCFFSFWSVSPLVRPIAFTLQGSHWNSPKASPSMGNFHRYPTHLFMNGGESDPSDFIWLQLFQQNIRVGPYSLTMPLCNGIIIDVPCLQLFNLYFAHPGLGSWIGFWRKTTGGSGVPVQWHGKLWHCNSWKLIPRWEGLTVWKFGVWTIWWRTKIWGRSMEI